METKEFVKRTTVALACVGAAVTVPLIAPYLATVSLPFWGTVLAGIFTAGVPKVGFGSTLLNTATGVLTNLASSALEKIPSTLEAGHNYHLERLLATAYLASLVEIETMVTGKGGEPLRSQATLVIPLIRSRLRRGLDSKQVSALFPVPAKTESAGAAYANRLSAETISLMVADDAKWREQLGGEVEIALRRWLNEEQHATTDRNSGVTSLALSAAIPLPDQLRALLRDELPSRIAHRISELVKQREFKESWIAFQRAHLQAVLRVVQSTESSGKDVRQSIDALEAKIEGLITRDDFVEALAEKLGAFLADISVSRYELEDLLARQSEELQRCLGEQIEQSTTRLSQEINDGSAKVVAVIRQETAALHDLIRNLNHPDELQKSAREQVSRQLPCSSSAITDEFSSKYDPALFVPRMCYRPGGIGYSINEAFWNRFVFAAGTVSPSDDRSRRTNCFVIVGRTGTGKTNVVCELAQKACARRDIVPVLIPGSLLEGRSGVSGARDSGLFRALLKGLSSNSPAGSSHLDELEDLHGIFRGFAEARPELRIVILLDAINELPSHPDGREFDLFNRDFRMLLQKLRLSVVAGEPLAYRVRFCVTCRLEYWRQFSDQASDVWTEFVYDAPQQGLPSMELGEFGKDEFNLAVSLYFKAYQIAGVQVRGRAREVLREPVMLRYFCEAYGSRTAAPPLLSGGVVESVSRMEVLDRLYRALEPAGKTDPAQSEAAFRLTTRFLICLAYYVHRRGGSRSFSLQEAQLVAGNIGHPDAELSEAEFETSQRSMFRRMVGHRLIEKDSGRDNYWFVLDSHYELWLGRYFASMDWAGKSDEDVLRSLDSLLGRSDESLESPPSAGFSDVIGALPYAVLMVESDEQFARQRQLFLKIIQTLLQGPYLWAQQGLAILRDSQLAIPSSWSHAVEAQDSGRTHQKLRDLRTVMNLIETIVSSGAWDHVQLADVRRTLLQLARAHILARWHVLNGLLHWASTGAIAGAADTGEVGPRLCRIYAAGTLLSLRTETEPDQEFDEVFKQFVHSPLIAHDFWTIRSLVAAADRSVRNAAGVSDAAAETRKTYFESILHIAEANADPLHSFSEAIAIRGECVAALCLLAQAEPPLIQSVKHLLAAEQSVWIWWRLVHALRSWNTDWSLEFPQWAIERAYALRSRHLDDAIYRTNVELENKGITLAGPTPSLGWDLEPERSSLTRGSPAEGVIVYHPIFLEPEYANHVECRERLASILFALREQTECAWGEPCAVKDDLLRDVHNAATDRHRGGAAWPNYLLSIKEAEESALEGGDEGQISGPMEMRPGVLRVARFSAGAVEAAVRYLLEDQSVLAAWAVNRPPGHLANNIICVLNNAACGAQFFIRHTRSSIPRPGRVVIFDFDAHHGKHTQHVFYRRQDVVYVSLHGDASYSREEGTIDAAGEAGGLGFTFNLPYPGSCRDETFLILIDEFVLPILLGLEPSLIVLSCGFDALATDAVTPQGLLTVAAFAGMARLLREAVEILGARSAGSRPKIAGTLEGGYSLPELGKAFVAVVREFGARQSTDEIAFERQNDPELIAVVRARVRERLDRHKDDPGALGRIYAEAQGRTMTPRLGLRPG